MQWCSFRANEEKEVWLEFACTAPDKYIGSASTLATPRIGKSNFSQKDKAIYRR